MRRKADELVAGDQRAREARRLHGADGAAFIDLGRADQVEMIERALLEGARLVRSQRRHWHSPFLQSEFQECRTPNFSIESSAG
jgi:hypothetical protein